MRRPSLILVLIATVALLLALAWESFRADREAEASLARVRGQRVQLDAEVRNAEKRLAEAKRARERLLARPAAPKPPAPRRARAGAPNVNALLRNNPKLQTLYFNSLRAQQRNNYAPFFHTLGLSPEQIEKMEDLNLQAAERIMDLRWAAQSEGTGTGDPAYLALQQQVRDQLAADTRNLIGEAGYQQLQQLERAGPVSYVVGELGAAVAATPTPLSAEQGAQLTQILANASSGYQSGKVATLDTVDWDAALGQAQGILSEPQMMALQTTVASYREGQALRQLSGLVGQAKPGK
jgi:hypothetical protein